MTTRVVTLAILALAAASEVGAQWSAPSFLPPRPGDDVGLYASSVEDFGVQAVWRQHGNLNLGVRAGWIESPVRGGVVAAAESWGLLFQAGRGLPVDVAWTVGAGVVFADGTALEVPVGATVGRTLSLAAVDIQVYAHPRLALIVREESDDVDETVLGGLFDVGAEFTMRAGPKARMAATVGSFDALGIGVAVPWGRSVEVR
jgi:hypothetical protein